MSARPLPVLVACALMLAACAGSPPKPELPATPQDGAPADGGSGAEDGGPADGGVASADAAPVLPRPADPAVQPAPAAGLQVLVHGLRDRRGTIRFALFDRAPGFPDQHSQALATRVVPGPLADDGVVFTKLAEGTYALAVIHDANDNATLDRNFLGMPTEGFGVSNNPPARFGPPQFHEAVFTYTPPGLRIELEIHYY